MIRIVVVGFLLIIVSMNLCGCVALLAGAGGTALWQTGKIISEEAVSMSRAVLATEKAFKAKKITVAEKTVKTQVTQLRGRNQTGKGIGNFKGCRKV